MNALDSKIEGAEGSAPSPLPPTDLEPVTRKPGQTATHAVLFTPELLCNIISQLPLADIVTTTGVCHFWRNAVAADPQVQKALFLKPEEVRRGQFFLSNDSQLDEFLSEVKSGDAIKDVTKMDACHIIGRVHPYLAKICNTWFLMRGSVENMDTIATAPNFNHPDGSWRRMFITQPPCQTVMIMVETEDNEEKWVNNFRYRDIDGVRLGGLYDRMRRSMTTIHAEEFHIMAWILGYSKQGTENYDTTMDIDIKDGTAYWPEEAAFEDLV